MIIITLGVNKVRIMQYTNSLMRLYRENRYTTPDTKEINNVYPSAN